MKRLTQRAVHYDLQKLEFQSTGTETDGHFRMTRLWRGDTGILGLQTHQQLLNVCGRQNKKLTLVCWKSEVHIYELIATGYGLTISDTNKT
jgi:hypothetical protein